MLVTNIGIVAGFVLIALQLQQSTKAMGLQAEAIRDSSIVAAESAFMGETLADAYVIAQLEPADLTDGQLWQVAGYFTTTLLSLYKDYTGYTQGLHPESAWILRRERFVKEYNFPVARAYWNMVAPIWGDAEFREQLDKEYDSAKGDEYYLTVSAFKRELEKELKLGK